MKKLPRHISWWPESGALAPIPFLDGLRAVAVVLTILFHAWWGIPGVGVPAQDAELFPINYARTGVHLFFVLSGFLLFLPYARWIFGLQQRPSSAKFYLRRVLRVGPAYWACLLVLSLSGLSDPAVVKDIVVHILFLSNAFQHSIYSINGVFWTMAIEVQFYVFLPLIALLMWRISFLGLRIALPLVVLGLFGVSSVVGYMDTHHHIHSLTVSTFLTGETSLLHWLDVFGDGIVCGLLYVYITQVAQCKPDALYPVAILSFATGITILLLITFAPRMHALQIKGILIGMCYAAILFGLLFGPSMMRRPFASVPLRFVGLISYSMYLWHTIVIGWIEPHLTSFSPHMRVTLGFILGFLLSIPVAYLSYQLTERPFFAARKRAHEQVISPARGY